MYKRGLSVPIGTDLIVLTVPLSCGLWTTGMYHRHIKLKFVSKTEFWIFSYSNPFQPLHHQGLSVLSKVFPIPSAHEAGPGVSPLIGPFPSPSPSPPVFHPVCQSDLRMCPPYHLRLGPQPPASSCASPIHSAFTRAKGVRKGKPC